MLMPGFPTNKE